MWKFGNAVLVRGLKAYGTSPAAGTSATFTAPPEPLMPDATAPVSLAVPLGGRDEYSVHTQVDCIGNFSSGRIEFLHIWVSACVD